ncbi:transglutaminase domain-containing protein [Ruminococcus sp.]|uniref:transglutaminase domain-containing protein n=1 Tax=Ruminococcus sp. TaxID=41978 RepID=UPI0025D6B5DF|nr:transglutaminase domain-containing protein [Ruminococcus sp.]MCR4640278.1 hypothetical protein [Ruminococcus sp.]
MITKKTAALLTVLCAVLLVTAWRYIKVSGVFRKFPEPQYLTEEEAEIRPVYYQLKTDEKAIYTALYRGISEQKEHIPLPYEADGDEYSKIYCILEKQEGGFFFLDSVYYTAAKVRDARVVYRDIDSVERREKELREKVSEIVRGALNDDDYSLARYINDYLAAHCRYITGEDKEYASTAYGCLVEGEANCEGYAKAFELLASEFGMKSVLITGTTESGENHAWNQVKVGTSWYNIDVTWADTDDIGETRKMYFLCDDATFERTHFADNTLFEPFPCGNADDNYYVKNGLYADSAEKAEEIVRRELSSGNSVIELRFSDGETYNAFKHDYIESERIFQIASETGYPFGEQINLCLRESESEGCMTLDFTGE